MSLDIQHDTSHQRFVAVVEGQECVLEYRFADGVLTITHTGVPANLGGRGIAGEITRHVFETARAKGWKIVPACSYAQAFIERHPQYNDLIQ
jgi:predicted GNAT family acetyltransferase